MEECCVFQEPIFVPRQNAESEDDGWVLTMVYRTATNTTDLAILDAKKISKGPVALIRLPHHIPHGKGCLTARCTPCMPLSAAEYDLCSSRSPWQEY